MPSNILILKRILAYFGCLMYCVACNMYQKKGHPLYRVAFSHELQHMPRIHGPAQRVQGIHPDPPAIFEPAVVAEGELAASLVIPDLLIAEPVRCQWRAFLGLLIALPESSAPNDRSERDVSG
jgi:hypothetical protein